MPPDIFNPNEEWSSSAHVPSLDLYRDRYQKSIADPEAFWSNIAQRLDWIKPWKTVRKYDFVKGEIEWFSGGKLNVSYNCIDRHINNGHGDQIAIIWEGNDPNQSRAFTFIDVLKDPYTLQFSLPIWKLL